jgi:GTP-binding protein
MGTGDFTRAEIEAGRRLFAGDWQFVAATGTPASLPPMRGIEIAFAGRSNVGKSSLINALTGRKNLARISRTPGRTQELIFFTGGDSLNVVDMPGYGYAAAAKSKIAAWMALIDAFLRGRSNLARVYVLVDARHGLKPADDPALEALGQAAVSHQIILTKCDELRPAELNSRIAEVEAALAKRPAAFPTVLATSSRDATGIPELRAAIARLLAERGR